MLQYFKVKQHYFKKVALPPLGQRGLKVDKRKTGGPYPVRFKELYCFAN